MNQEETSQLTDDIDTVVWNASNQIEAIDQRSFIRANIPTALKLLIVVPVIAVGAQCLRWACWLSAGAFVSWTTSIILTCAVPLIWLFIKVATRQAAVSRQRALRATDQQLGSSERIVTADHFLQQPSRNGFMQAAVEDATDWAIRGRDAKLEQTPAKGPDFRRSIWPIPVAIAVLLLASFLTQFERTNVADDPVPPGVTRLADNSSIAQTPARPQRKPEPQEQEPANERPDSPRDQRSRRAVNRQGSAGAAIPDNAEESRGKLNEGETRESQQSANPSSAAAHPRHPGNRPKRVTRPNANQRRSKKRRPKKNGNKSNANKTRSLPVPRPDKVHQKDRTTTRHPAIGPAPVKPRRLTMRTWKRKTRSTTKKRNKSRVEAFSQTCVIAARR